MTLTAVIVGGCGGGGKTYALDPTASCLRANGVIVTTDEEDFDNLAQDAAEGAMEAGFSENSATIAFERSDNDAKRLRAAYAIFAGAFDTPADDILFQEGNAVIVWSKTPTEDESGQVDECLRG
jgi:hypothetical protein